MHPLLLSDSNCETMKQTLYEKSMIMQKYLILLTKENPPVETQGVGGGGVMSSRMPHGWVELCVTIFRLFYFLSSWRKRDSLKKPQRRDKKPKINKNGYDWGRLRRITKDKLANKLAILFSNNLNVNIVRLSLSFCRPDSTCSLSRFLFKNQCSS